MGRLVTVVTSITMPQVRAEINYKASTFYLKRLHLKKKKNSKHFETHIGTDEGRWIKNSEEKRENQ